MKSIKEFIRKAILLIIVSMPLIVFVGMGALVNKSCVDKARMDIQERAKSE